MELNGWTPHNLGFADIQVGNNIAVLNVHEGIDLQEEDAGRILTRIGQSLRGDYGLIFDEVNPYSMRFEAMLRFKQSPGIWRVGVVAYRPVTIGSMKMAMHVIGKPYKMFDELPNALAWMKRELEASA